MPVELSELTDLAAGKRPHLFVGDLPRSVAEQLNCHPARVYLGHKVFHHIVQKHDNIEISHFQRLPMMIRAGEYFSDPVRHNATTVVYTCSETGKLYLTGLKSAANGCEVWVQTLFRTTLKKSRGKRNPARHLFGPQKETGTFQS